ncbi:MAG: hypothetical protein HY553_14700 [Elusimicrobia bacterium]|nr:hypothetical protein [Elusimicrobiota bacterium]
MNDTGKPSRRRRAEDKPPCELLKAAFERTFGLPFPALFQPDPVSEPLSEDSDRHLCFSKAAGSSGRLPVVHWRGVRPGTWLAGFWGYGVNSYAWYFVRRDRRRAVFLRLPYGGAYGDSEHEALAVKAFTERYVAFEQWAETHLSHWRIENCMGTCRGWVRFRDGRRVRLERAEAEDFRFPNEPGKPSGEVA